MAGLGLLLNKLLVVVAAIALVVILSIWINDWRDNFLFSLFFTGQWENLLYLLVFSLALVFILRKLAQMQFHNFFVGRRK